MSVLKPIINPFNGQLQLINDEGLLFFKEAVASQANLPLSGNMRNDARIVNDTGHLYVWSSEEDSGLLTDWIDQGDILDLTWAAIQGKPDSTTTDIDDAVSKRHTQNTDIALRTDKLTVSPNGNTNCIGAMLVKEGTIDWGVFSGNSIYSYFYDGVGQMGAYDFSNWDAHIPLSIDGNPLKLNAWSNGDVTIGSAFAPSGNYLYKVPKMMKESSSVNMYVDGTLGNDSNNGFNSATPFKTISKAISLIPEVVVADVSIWIKGSQIYTENILLNDKVGCGIIRFRGWTSTPTLKNSSVFSSIQCNSCNVLVFIQNFIFIHANSNVGQPFCTYFNRCEHVEMYDCYFKTEAPTSGNSIAIYAQLNTKLVAFNCGDSDVLNKTSFGLYSYYGSIIRTNMILGTIPVYQNTGTVITGGGLANPNSYTTTALHGNPILLNPLSSDGNVGIGKDSLLVPDLLTVRRDDVSTPAYITVDNALTGDKGFQIKQNGAVLTGWGAASGLGTWFGNWINEPVKIFAGASPRITILPDGKVGIGTTTPPDLLSVREDSGFPKITVDNGEAGGYAGFYIKKNGVELGGMISNGTSVNVGAGDGGNLIPYTIYTGGTYRIHILPDGKVGIGTFSPTEILDVGGNIKLDGNITDGTNASSPANIKDAVDKKHVASQVGSSAPTLVTPDYIGQIYVNTSPASGESGVYVSRSLTIGDWYLLP